MNYPTLKISDAAVSRPATAVAGPLQLTLTVENPVRDPLFVWASWRSYDYDAASQLLTVYLTEQTPTPPGITLISDHPRTPAQVTVAPKSKLKLKVQVPATIRRRVPAVGLGLNFVEEPIGPVAQVEAHVQFATEEIALKAKETPEQHRSRLLAHGAVVRVTLTNTEHKE